MTSFGVLSRKLVEEHRISVVPVVPASKDPGYFSGNDWHSGLKWGKYALELPTPGELAKWGAWPDSGIAVVLGELSGIVAVDFDYHPQCHKAIAALLPDTPVKKIGVKGLTHFFRYNGEKTVGFPAIDGKKVVEILSEHLCVIPPSVHPEGCLYEWEGKGLDEVPKEDLPTIPENFPALVKSLIDAWFPKPVLSPPVPRTPPFMLDRDTDLADAKTALSFIPPDEYDVWVRMGMAIQSAFPSSDGYSLWCEWSSASPKYKEREMPAKWRSFKGGKNGGVTIASLFKLAMEYGYRRERRSPPAVTFSGAIKDAIAGDEEPSAPETTLALPLDLLTSAPGLVGEIADWITQNNRYYQPSYSLAAALSLVGMIKGHNVCTEEDGRTNLLTIAVGVSGSGKSQPNGLIQEIISKAGLSSFLLGEPKSETGFLKSLKNSGAKGLLLWDEIGVAFKGLFSSYAPSYQTGIIRQFLKLYSMANQVVIGQEFADADGKNPRIDLNQPCFCLYGTTTKEGIFGAFSSTEAVNGFAARLLIFETHDYLTPRRKQFKKTPLPEWLVEKVKAVANAGVSVGTIIAPTTVPYSEEARAVMGAAEEWFEGQRVEAIKANRASDISIWSRAYEQASKVALAVEDGSEISEDCAAWAVELITQLSRRMIVAASEQIADNETHAEVNKVLGIIKSAGGWVSTTELFERTRGLSSLKRRDILAGLEEEEKIEKKEWATTGRKKLVYRAI